MMRVTARSVSFCRGHSNFALLSHGLSIQNWKLAILNWPFLHMIIMFLGFIFSIFYMNFVDHVDHILLN